MAPRLKTIDDSIKAVVEAENMVYIFDLSRTAIPFVNDKVSVDVTAKVKAKLGI